MAKLKKTKATPKPALRLDAAGWGFWLVMFCLLIGPLAYGGWKLGMVEQNALQYGLLVFVAAAIGAGVIAWLTNLALQALAEHRRKKAKKR
jgi:hypothetical protein